MHEYAETKGYKHTERGTELRVIIPKKELGDYLKRFSKDGIVQAELRLDDGRTISAEQRKKIYATIRDISSHTGHLPEELKELMKYNYMIESGEDYFSFSNCSISDICRGNEHIAEMKRKRDIAETMHETTYQKIYAIKLEMGIIERQMEVERKGL